MPAPPGYSDGYYVYIAGGSHASYAHSGYFCTHVVEPGDVCWCHDSPQDNYIFPVQNSHLIPLYELGDSRAPIWANSPYRWPGNSASCIGHDVDCPYGPAFGDHAEEWNNGAYFVSSFSCLTNSAQQLLPPCFVEVLNYSESFAPIYNKLRVTWCIPPMYTGANYNVVIHRKFSYQSEDEYVCVVDNLPAGTDTYMDDDLLGGYVYDYSIRFRLTDDPPWEYTGCSRENHGSMLCLGHYPFPDQYEARIKNCINGSLEWFYFSLPDSFQVMKRLFQHPIRLPISDMLYPYSGQHNYQFYIQDCAPNYLYSINSYKSGLVYCNQEVFCTCPPVPGACPVVWIANNMINNILPLSEFINDTSTILTDELFFKSPGDSAAMSNEITIQIYESEENKITSLKTLELFALDYSSCHNLSLDQSGDIHEIKDVVAQPDSVLDNLGNNITDLLAQRDRSYFFSYEPGYLIAYFNQEIYDIVAHLPEPSAGIITYDPGKMEFLKTDAFADFIDPNVLYISVGNDRGEFNDAHTYYPRQKPGANLLKVNAYIEEEQDFIIKMEWSHHIRLDELLVRDLEPLGTNIIECPLIEAELYTNGSSSNVTDRLLNLDSSILVSDSQTLFATYSIPGISGGMDRYYILKSSGSYQIAFPKASGEMPIPDASMLLDVYPNPFNPDVHINCSLKNGGITQLYIINLLGQKVATILDDEYLIAGNHHFQWNSLSESGKEVSSGVYFAILKQGPEFITRKLVMLK